MAGPSTPAALYKMISIPEAQNTVLQETHTLPSQTVDLSHAIGCNLAEDILAPEPLPPFPASIKVQPLQLDSHCTLHANLSPNTCGFPGWVCCPLV